MPVYQYACTECGEQLEVRQSFTDAALTVCPVCEGRLRKVLNAVGVVFKGSGFYRTDSRAAANGAGGGSSSGQERCGRRRRDADVRLRYRRRRSRRRRPTGGRSRSPRRSSRPARPDQASGGAKPAPAADCADPQLAGSGRASSTAWPDSAASAS